jgi:hypothetical protein
MDPDAVQALSDIAHLVSKVQDFMPVTKNPTVMDGVTDVYSVLPKTLRCDPSYTWTNGLRLLDPNNGTV